MDDQDLPDLRVATLVGALEGSVRLEIRLCELPASSAVPAHRHPFEESFHVLEGEAQFAVGDLAYELGPGDHGFVPVAVPHAWRNPSGARVRWLETRAPQPRRVGGRVGVYPAEGFVWPGLLGRPIETDPRHRWVGHFSDDDMPPRAFSMRATGPTSQRLDPMVDQLLGAQQHTLFMVGSPSATEGKVAREH
jgi:quercetin dioxygenase-like cupin family protein